MSQSTDVDEQALKAAYFNAVGEARTRKRSELWLVPEMPPADFINLTIDGFDAMVDAFIADLQEGHRAWLPDYLRVLRNFEIKEFRRAVADERAISDLSDRLDTRIIVWEAKAAVRWGHQGELQTSSVPIVAAQEPIPNRQALLDEYKRETGVTSDRQIYGCAGPGTHSCHKPQFLKWKDGRLPADSETAKSLERFLRERRRPPAPKKIDW